MHYLIWDVSMEVQKQTMRHITWLNRCIIAATTGHYFFVAVRMMVPLRWWTKILLRICVISTDTHIFPFM